MRLTMKRFIIKNDEEFAKAAERVCHVTHGGETEAIHAEKVEAVRNVLEAVRQRGDEAVAEFTERFDGVSLEPDEFEIAADEIDEALDAVDPQLRAALERAHDNIRRFHAKNLHQSWEETLEDGTILGQRITPIESVGVYVPGGKAFYPSSVLMNIVPARVAGVREIIMVSPPSYKGTVHPVVLAAARIARVDRVFRVGGAQAVAALAYGTDRVPAVLKITGPGNIYVTIAKSLVRSVCEIDSEAGPSEVTVIADETADPRLVAAELLAQAEHDEEACSVLITTSQKLADDVARVVDEELANLSRAAIIRASLETTGAVYIVRDLAEAARLSNLIAPEHLAIFTKHPRNLLELITNAGTIILGQDSTVVFGDYFAGPNHVLPTGRRARFASPLSAEDFRKVSNVIAFSPERVRATRDDIIRLARAEELTAHARAVELRS